MSIPRGIRSLLSLVSPSGKSPSLYYVAPFSNWSLDWDAHYITENIKKQFALNSKITRTTKGLSGQIVHYASLWDLVAHLNNLRKGRNKNVGTVFHGHKDKPEFRDALERVLANIEELDKLHVSCSIMEKRFISWGVDPRKLARIPLGVDLERFCPVDEVGRLAQRHEFGIPADAFCIGSFHKDGQGMTDGLSPKLIKGPDVLIDTLSQIHKKHKKIFVLLSAPARGYVIQGLDAAGIPYAHVQEEDFHRIPRLFHALDAYLLTSREEGGPKGVLEALASGVPFVGTRVGLVPDVVTNGEDGLLADIEDSVGLADCILRLIGDPELRQRLSENGLKRIQEFGWPVIAASYYRELYEPLLPVLR